VLDKELEKRSLHYVRYADDCNIYVRSQRAGERVTASVEGFLTKRLKLKVNKAKSAVAQPDTRKFWASASWAGSAAHRAAIGPGQQPAQPKPSGPLLQVMTNRGYVRRLSCPLPKLFEGQRRSYRCHRARRRAADENRLTGPAGHHGFGHLSRVVGGCRATHRASIKFGKKSDVPRRK
jgi:hypothetical protein